MPDIQIKSSDELQTGVSLQPADFHNLVNNATVQSGVIGDKTESETLASADELIFKENSGGGLKKIQWSNVAAEVAADFSLQTSSVDEGKSDFYENWDTPNTAKTNLVSDGFLPISKAATSEHPAIDVMAYGALGDNTGTVVAQWLTGGTKSRGYANLAAIQTDYPWVESLFDTIDFAACQKALDVAWSKIKATYGLSEDITSSGALLAQTNSESELDKSRFARSVEVLFPAGFFKINKTLIVPPSCSVRGSGSGSTVIRYTGDRFSDDGTRQTNDYTDDVTVGGATTNLARKINKRKWKYYSDKTDYKVPLRINGMHAVMMVRDELKYTTANVTTGIYHAVGTVTAGGTLSTGASFLVNNGSGYANGDNSINYDNGSTQSATTFHAEGGSFYTSLNDLTSSGTLTGGTLTNPFSNGYFEDGVDDNEKFYAQQSLTVDSTGQRIYPGTKINFTSGAVFVVTDNEAAGSTALVGYLESGSIANDEVGTIDVYSSGYNPTGGEQAGDESLAGNKNRIQDMDAHITGIHFSGYVEDDTIGLWLPGFTHRNNRYSDLLFRGYKSFQSSDISGTPNDSSKGMFGIMLNNGSKDRARVKGVDLSFTGNTFEACYAGLITAGTSDGILFSGNHLKYNRFGVRLDGLHHTVSTNRFDGFSTDSQSEVPHRIGETAVYMRYPVGNIITGNSVEHHQRAFELYGTTNVNINGNSITVPDPTGRNATHDYTLGHGFVVYATGATYTYADAGEGDSFKHNAGLLINGNNWTYNNFTNTAKSPLCIDEDANDKMVFGLASGNGSWPKSPTVETLLIKINGGTTVNQNFRFWLDDPNEKNKIHTAFTNIGISDHGSGGGQYASLQIKDMYGIARGTFSSVDGANIILLPNPKLNTADVSPLLSGNEFYLSLYKNKTGGSSSTISIKAGATIAENGIVVSGGKLKMTTSLDHGLEAGDRIVMANVDTTSGSDSNYNKIHVVETVHSSTEFTTTTTSSPGTISVTTVGGWGYIYFPQRMVEAHGVNATYHGTNAGAASGDTSLTNGVGLRDGVTLYSGSYAAVVKIFKRIVLDNTSAGDGHWIIME